MSALVIASNRGPWRFTLQPDGRLSWRRGAGGLVSALTPALEGHACTWISAAITDGDRAAADGNGSPEGPAGSQLRMLTFEPTTYERYYHDVANRTLWFLQHHLLDTAGVAFDHRFRAAWASYREVNRAFAEACDEATNPGGEVHLEDYHLALAPAMLRERRPDVRILHLVCCPWAGPDDFGVLPDAVACELLAGMLGADLIGFLTHRWARSFLACCEAAGYEVDRQRDAVRAKDGHVAHVRPYPLGVDEQDLRRLIRQGAAVTGGPDDAPSRGVPDGGRLVVRVDRLEPSKNIVRGLDAFAAFLEQNPRFLGEVTHLVLVSLSREGMAEYRRYHCEVEQRAEMVNQRFGTAGWTPVRLVVLDDHPRALRAMAAADVLVVNPVWDGMNLVAKEAACVNERDAVLILSRNAGAADDLRAGALLVNPFDTAELADTLATALSLEADDRAERARQLREGASRMPPRQWLLAQRHDLARMQTEGSAWPRGKSPAGEKGGLTSQI